MLYQQLNNGVQMPLLGFGTYLATDEVCEESVLTAIRTGYRMIDTAAIYGNEAAVGRAIAKCGVPREELFIITKVDYRAYDQARAAVEESLSKLQLEYVDLVLLHWPFGNYYAAWRELEKLYDEGKIRAIGVSNFHPDRLADLIAFNRIVPAVNQNETHLYCQRKVHHVWEKKYGVAHQGYTPLGRGRANEMFEEEPVRQMAEKYGKSPAQILLRFLMQSGVSVVPKSVHEARIAENFDLFDFELTAEEVDSLAALDQNAPLIGTPEDPQRVENMTR